MSKYRWRERNRLVVVVAAVAVVIVVSIAVCLLVLDDGNDVLQRAERRRRPAVFLLHETITFGRDVLGELFLAVAHVHRLPEGVGAEKRVRLVLARVR